MRRDRAAPDVRPVDDEPTGPSCGQELEQPLATERWQVVAQMKQANPSDLAVSGTGYGYSPVLVMIADHSRWAVENNWNRIWEAPARKGTWVRFAYDVRYSADPERGWIRVYADLNGDGDALDPYEAQPTIRTDTLKPRSLTRLARTATPMGSRPARRSRRTYGSGSTTTRTSPASRAVACELTACRSSHRSPSRPGPRCPGRRLVAV